MEKRSICLTQIRSHVNFGNNLREARAKYVRFYFVTLKLHRSTCYVNWAILIGDLVDVTTLLLAKDLSPFLKSGHIFARDHSLGISSV